MALLAQPARDEGCHLRLVFDYEHTHRPIFATVDEKAMRAFTLFSSAFAPLRRWKHSLAPVAGLLDQLAEGPYSRPLTETPA